MMDLAAIRTGLGTWMTGLTGLTVHWQRRPQNWRAQAWIKARITSPVMVGRDSLTHREDGNDLYPQQKGLRSFTLEIQVWSHSFDDDKDALHYHNIIQDSLVHSYEDFRAIGIGFGEILNTAFFDQKILRREADMVQVDVLFHADASRENATANTWIETVEMEGDLGNDGTIQGEFP